MSQYTFYTVNREPRPIRLSEETRGFAWASLHGKYGDEAMASLNIPMDGCPGFAAMSDLEKERAALLAIAEKAPLRLCPAEKVCGAATLGWAICAQVPVSLSGHPVIGGVNHLTVNFFTPVRKGMDAVEAEILARMEDETLTDRQRVFLGNMKATVDAMRLWHGRYLEATKDARPDLHKLLSVVPFKPAANFREAVQSLWFCFAFTRLTGNWPGLGRIDQLLGPYLEADLAAGAITLDEAREYIASLMIKGCEWIQSQTPVGSGDAQHYQNLVLGGRDEDGVEVTNDVTYLILDAVEELAISDYPITVRLWEGSPEKLIRRVAEVQRHGGGIVAVYNEPLILKALARQGYSAREAMNFANDGCWEVQIPGRTRFSYCPFDALQVLQDHVLRLNTDEPAHFDDFETLYGAFREALGHVVDGICEGLLNAWIPDWRNGGRAFAPQGPCTVVSLFEDGCLESARSYSEGGTPYTVISPHIGGAPDVGNSLHAIDVLVFKENRVTFDRLMEILKTDWEGEEVLRQYARHHLSCYGNDDDEADAYTVRVLNDFAALCEPWARKYPVWFPSGVSTFGRQIEWAPHRLAVPFGYRHGDILAGNCSPTPGTDTEGATAVIRSYCKADLSLQTTGTALDVRLFPSTVEGRNGVVALESLLRGFLSLGGFFMQTDVADAAILKAAQCDPDKYKTLSVRVSGWNARFVTLNREWQEMIIERTEHKV